jgi:hypothetical protein
MLTSGARRHRRRAAVAATLILAGSLAERFAVMGAGPPSARATAAGETVRATPSELGRPPRPDHLR